MALAAVGMNETLDAATSLDWQAIQFAQFEHDEKYHREISRLTVQDRLKHMALHFAKYAGRLHEEVGDDDFRRTMVDVLIIAISSANILNVRLAERQLTAVHVDGNRDDFVRQLTIAAGRMSAACEKMDHLEDFPFRSTIQENVIAILRLCLDRFAGEGWNPIVEMKARLLPIKQKSIFHVQL